jgi:hypothetical protein
MHPLRLALAAFLACLASGCTLVASDDTVPIVADVPNPAPVRGYKVQCRSIPDPFFGINGVVHADCTQVIPESRGGRVVRAKG